MIIQATFSRPAKNAAEILGKPYIKVRIWKKAGLAVPALSAAIPSAQSYEAEFFTQTQGFRKSLSEKEAQDFIALHAGKTFRTAVIRTESEEETIMSNRHGKITSLKKPLPKSGEFRAPKEHNRKKHYLFEEGKPVPFLVELGVMTREGKVIAQKYDKFRQINRFAEYIDDVIPQLKKDFTTENPLTVVDFGSGKSYLTFAAYHLLHEIRKIPVSITGLDLKKDVIERCNKLAADSGYADLHFAAGDIADFEKKKGIDMVITLHACDTATDFALGFAIKNDVPAILSVPCCQHEINAQLEKNKPLDDKSPLASLTRYPLLRERLASLATDALRAELLEQNGYSVQALEFVDMSGTPKNILLRAVKTNVQAEKKESGRKRIDALMQALDVSQTLESLLQG